MWSGIVTRWFSELLAEDLALESPESALNGIRRYRKPNYSLTHSEANLNPTLPSVLSSVTDESVNVFQSFGTAASSQTNRRCYSDPEGVAIVLPIFDRFCCEFFDWYVL